MAVTLTPRLGLTRWGSETDPWPGRAGFDAQNDLLDDLVAIDLQGLKAARPAPEIPGRYYFATDEDQLYRDDGDAWTAIGVAAAKLVGLVPLGSIPNLPAERTTSGVFNLARIPVMDAAHIPNLDTSKVTTGEFAQARIPLLDVAKIPALPASKVTSGEFDAARIPDRIQPVGVLEEFVGAVAQLPAGWLVCDGSAVARAAYPQLFARVGTRFGVGDGATTFNLPTLAGRYVGPDISTTTISDVATARSGWLIERASAYLSHGEVEVRVRCERTSNLAINGNTGNTPETPMCTIKVPFRPRELKAFWTGSTSRVGSGWVSPSDGVATLSAVGGQTSLATGEIIDLHYVTRVVADDSNMSLMIIRAV